MTIKPKLDEVLGVASTAHALGEPIAVGGADAPPALSRTVVGPPDAAAEPAAAPLAGARYRPLGLLGEGGMGRVEHALDADLMRHVAVKRLRPNLAGDAAMVRQFLWEARVSAYLDHPNIAPVHDVGLAEGRELFFTMARVQGLSLAEVVKGLREGDRALGERFSQKRRLRLFIQVTQAVAFAHARGVLHRDLKPANVMLGEHGEVRVMDWGLALPLPGAAGDALRLMMPEGIEREAVSGGTPRYMSPEQARNEPLDARSDVFALGAILYELTVLEPAVEGSTVSEVLDNLRRGRTRVLAQASGPTPASLRAVVARAMAPAREDRYASAAALADDVERVVDGLTPEAERVSLVRRAARFYVARDPAMARLHVWEIDFWAAAAFFVGVAAGAAAGGWLHRWAWLVALVGLAAGTPPTLHWWRLRRQSR